ncbi:DUF6909 family protein [Candidatus Contubernalis alkaliaceticus]|uniref:DUF6909 family protein n=1 Tax=Candidatus Contubernalis alkaliaceticus TaxID=338645 RepID=UPI001F4C2080|nr:hypothetical protein [Candidatus Contubernalis alkalaceticus]UNC91066.1 hypothetical protein HUE98_02580 [Candidatus Contubernalis alkalaceticus]
MFRVFTLKVSLPVAQGLKSREIIHFYRFVQVRNERVMMIEDCKKIIRSGEKKAMADDQTVNDYLKSLRFIGKGVKEMNLESLHKLHCRLDSSLHRGAGEPGLTPSAILYSSARLPKVIDQANRILISGNQEFLFQTLAAGHNWQKIQAQARRRTIYFDGVDTLSILIASFSDLDDLITALCAYQIEWNKIHRLLAGHQLGVMLANNSISAYQVAEPLRKILGLGRADFEALQNIQGHNWQGFVARIAAGPKNFALTMLPVSVGDFRRTASKWWEKLFHKLARFDLESRPVYLITSNTHALANLVTGFAPAYEKEGIQSAEIKPQPELAAALNRLKQALPGERRNMNYYLLHLLEQKQPRIKKARYQAEKEAGLTRIFIRHPLMLEAQIVELAHLRPELLDPRINLPQVNSLEKSRAVILNLDYPLGLAAGHLINEAASRLKEWKGLYIMGKSAAMIGRLGDILIPCEVFDSHTGNHFILNNCLGLRNVLPFVENIAVFGEQRSLTVHGAFLHSRQSVHKFISQDFTGIEMEAGPIMVSLEQTFNNKPLVDKNLKSCMPHGFSLGLLHYTSDTPYNLRGSLLSRRLGLTGLEAVYACGLAILQDIINKETRG